MTSIAISITLALFSGFAIATAIGETSIFFEPSKSKLGLFCFIALGISISSDILFIISFNSLSDRVFSRISGRLHHLSFQSAHMPFGSLILFGLLL